MDGARIAYIVQREVALEVAIDGRVGLDSEDLTRGPYAAGRREDELSDVGASVDVVIARP
jgi:hypothetical protein